MTVFEICPYFFILFFFHFLVFNGRLYSDSVLMIRPVSVVISADRSFSLVLKSLEIFLILRRILFREKQIHSFSVFHTKRFSFNREREPLIKFSCIGQLSDPNIYVYILYIFAYWIFILLHSKIFIFLDGSWYDVFFTLNFMTLQYNCLLFFKFYPMI